MEFPDLMIFESDDPSTQDTSEPCDCCQRIGMCIKLDNCGHSICHPCAANLKTQTCPKCSEFIQRVQISSPRSTVHAPIGQFVRFMNENEKRSTEPTLRDVMIVGSEKCAKQNFFKELKSIETEECERKMTEGPFFFMRPKSRITMMESDVPPTNQHFVNMIAQTQPHVVIVCTPEGRESGNAIFHHWISCLLGTEVHAFVWVENCTNEVVSSSKSGDSNSGLIKPVLALVGAARNIRLMSYWAMGVKAAITEIAKEVCQVPTPMRDRAASVDRLQAVVQSNRNRRPTSTATSVVGRTTTSVARNRKVSRKGLGMLETAARKLSIGPLIKEVMKFVSGKR